jgi:hypothetical protein
MAAMEEAGLPNLFFQLRVGQEVQYYTKETKQWIPTTIIELDVLKKSFRVGCKKNTWHQDTARLRLALDPGLKQESEEQKDIRTHFDGGSSLFCGPFLLVKLAFLLVLNPLCTGFIAQALTMQHFAVLPPKILEERLSRP